MRNCSRNWGAVVRPRCSTLWRALLGLAWVTGRLAAQEADSPPPSESFPATTVEISGPAEGTTEGTAPAAEATLSAISDWFHRTFEVLREKGLAGDETALRRAWIEALTRVADPGAQVFAPDKAPAEGDAPDAKPPFCETEPLPRQLVRIEVKTLASGAGLAIGAAIDQAFREGAAGIALDLRRAGGYSLADIGHVAARYVTGSEAVLEVHDLKDQVIERVMAWGVSLTRGRRRPPMIVLVGPETRGAAEALAAALDRRPGVMTIGQETANDPPIRETVMLPDGWSVRVATRRIVFPDGGALDATHRFVPRRKLPSDLHPEPDELEGNGTSLDRRKTVPQEAEDRRLRDRVRNDPELRIAVDLLLALAALQPEA